MFGNVDEEAYNRANLEAMPFLDLVKVILKLQRQINEAHEKIRVINRNNLKYKGRLEKEKKDASDYSDKVKENIKDLCNEMDIAAYTHTERFTALRNALNASNLCFKQQFSELCDDMKIHSNNNQVSRYNDLRRFMNEIFLSSNISYSGNNSDCSRSASNSSKRNSDTVHHRPKKYQNRKIVRFKC